MKLLNNLILVIQGVLCILICTNHAYSQSNSQKASVTYIANCGYLVQFDGKSVLFDAVYDPYLNSYTSPTVETIDKMVNTLTPFEKIDFMFVSHYHHDHFDADVVGKVLKAHPECKLVSCQQTIDSLKFTANTLGIAKETMIALTPRKYHTIDTIFDDVSITAVRLKHSPYFKFDTVLNKNVNKHKYVQNIGLLVKIGDCTLFHSGDANSQSKKEFELFKLNKSNIDIAFLGRGFFWSPKSPAIEILKNNIAPKHIFVDHFRLENLEIYQSVANEMIETFPHVYFLKEPLESTEITINH
jgi:L-ascorbate metabolism protein UlaG (beta-lactamase superfamily)